MKKELVIMGLLLGSFTNSNAQLLGKLKKANDQVNTATEVVKTAEDVVKTGEDVSKKAKKKGAAASGTSSLKLDWNTYKQTPAITFNSLLYGTEPGRFSNYTGTFIPTKTTSGATVDIVSDQAEFLKIKVYKDGKYITYFEYDGGQQFDDGKKIKFNTPKSRYKRDGEWVGMPVIEVNELGTGNYRLDFFAGDKMFYTFDFEIHKLVNTDPYAAMNEMYVTRGPWNNYAYMNYDESGNLVFGFYYTHEEFKPDPANSRKTNKSVKWSLKVLKDNKPFAQQYGTGAPNVAQVEQAKWNEYRCALKLVDKPGEFKFANLTDGAYKVELSIEGEAKPRIYNFTVKDKRIVQIPEQDRTKNTDPTRLIEGWNDYFWMKLEK